MGPNIVVVSACPLRVRPLSGPASEPPLRVTRGPKPKGRALRHESRCPVDGAGLFDRGPLLGATPRTRSCSHDIFTARSRTLMRFQGVEFAHNDDAPTPSAFELEMSSPLSKSREHRSRGPKPSARPAPSEEGATRTSSSRWPRPKPRHWDEQY